MATLLIRSSLRDRRRSHIVRERRTDARTDDSLFTAAAYLRILSATRVFLGSVRCRQRARPLTRARLPRSTPACCLPPSRAHSDFPILMTQISFIRSLFANYGRKEGRDKGRAEDATEGKGRRVQRAEAGGRVGAGCDDGIWLAGEGGRGRRVRVRRRRHCRPRTTFPRHSIGCVSVRFRNPSLLILRACRRKAPGIFGA